MPYGNVFAKINNEYYQLTGAEKKVADYAVAHQQKTQYGGRGGRGGGHHLPLLPAAGL